MSVLLIVLIILTAISVIVMIIGFIDPVWVNDGDGWKGFGVISLMCIAIFGWALIGTFITVREKISPVEVFRSKSNKSIILECYGSDEFYVFDKKVDFDNITDTTTFYSMVGINIYNFVTDKHDVFYYDENNITCEGKIK